MSAATTTADLGAPLVTAEDRTWGVRAIFAWSLVGAVAGILSGIFVAAALGHQDAISLSPRYDLEGPIEFRSVSAGMLPGALFGLLFGAIFGLPAIVAAAHLRRDLPRRAVAALALSAVAAALVPPAITLAGSLADPPRDQATGAVQSWAAERYEADLTDGQAGALLDYVNDSARPDSLDLGGGTTAVSDPDTRSVSLSDPR